MKKMVRALALVLSLALVLTSCASNKKPEEITLKFSWWGGDARHEATQAAIDKYVELNPHVKIETDFGGWTGWQDKITTEITGKTAADVMQINWNWLWLFSKDGNGFYDLSKVKKHLDLDNYDKDILAQTTMNGKVNAIPVGLTGKVFYYNATTYEKAGIDFPKTQDELIAAAKVFKEKLGADYYPLDMDQYGAFLNIINYLERKTGKGFIGTDNKVAYTKEELADGFKWYDNLVKEGVVPSMETRAAAGNVSVDQTPSWIQGKYGGVYEWDSAIDKFQKALDGEQKLGLADYIGYGGENNAAFAKVSMGFAINKDCKYPEEAAKFLQFMVAEEAGVEIIGTSRGIPCNNKAVEILVNKGLLKGLSFDGNKLAIEKKGLQISPYFENPELQAHYKSVVEEFGFGRIDAEKAADEITTFVNEKLAELAK